MTNKPNRSYILTLFSEELVNGAWQELHNKLWGTTKCVYMCSQLEKCPETGRLHWQAFVKFKDGQRGTWIKTHCDNRLHFEAVTVERAEAIGYGCKAETRVEGPLENGTKPKAVDKHGKGGEATKQKWEKIKVLGPEKALDEGLFHIKDYDKVVKNMDLYKLRTQEPMRTDEVKGIWVYGEPGVGKSHWVKDNYPGHYLKAQNKWWDGYSGQEAVLIDDFDKHGACLSHYLKIWADKWECTGEVKGGTIPLSHKHFIITSNYLPGQLWKPTEDSELIKAIERRFLFVRIDLNNGIRDIVKHTL